MRVPYTYLIDWPEHDKWYYGVRFARGCDPNELWVTYFTSSNYVDAFVKEHGKPPVVEVRKIFDRTQVAEAREYEHKTLRRLKVMTDDRWLNKSTSRSIPPMFGNDNAMSNPIHRETQRLGAIRGHRTPSARKNHSEATKKSLARPETNKKLRDSAKKAHNTPEVIQRHVEASIKFHSDPEIKRRHKAATKKSANSPKRLALMRSSSNPNNIRLCCLTCKRETPLPLFKTNHRKCLQ